MVRSQKECTQLASYLSSYLVLVQFMINIRESDDSAAGFMLSLMRSQKCVIFDNGRVLSSRRQNRFLVVRVKSFSAINYYYLYQVHWMDKRMALFSLFFFPIRLSIFFFSSFLFIFLCGTIINEIEIEFDVEINFFLAIMN